LKIDSLLNHRTPQNFYTEPIVSSNSNNHSNVSKRLKLSSKENSDLEDSINHDLLINENRYLKKRLAENLAEISNKDATITRLEYEIENLKKMQNNENLKEYCTADKLIDLATYIFNNFSTSSNINDMNAFQQEINNNDVENNSNHDECVDSNEDYIEAPFEDNELMVPICDIPKYAEHKMRGPSKISIYNLAQKVNKNNKRTESSYVFRKVLNAALEDEKWAEHGTDGIMRTYKTKLEACKIYMNSLRPDYSEQDMVTAIRSKCSDVKKQLAINQRKKSQTQSILATQSNQPGSSNSFASSNGYNNSSVNHVSTRESRQQSYTNGSTPKVINKIEPNNYVTNSDNFLMDESSSEYFQNID
jgi:hypothetical protein